MSDVTPAGPGALTKRGFTSVGLASLVAAAAGFAVMLIAARTLEPARNADFLAFWSLLFAVFGILSGVQNETTRSVRSAYSGDPQGSQGARVLPIGLAVGAALAALLAATSPWWSARALGDDHAILVAAIALACLVFSGHVTVAGSLSGAGRWPVFAGLVSAEATVRLVIVGIAALVGTSVAGLEVGAAAAAGTWLVFLLLSPSARAAALARADVPPAPFLRRIGHAMLAAASSAALVVGFPFLLRLTSTTPVYAASAPLILAISLTRAPLLIPLGAYQGVAITQFLTHRERGLAALRSVTLGVLALGAVGAGLAFLAGPWLMSAMIGPDYQVDGILLAGLTFAAALLALLTLTGAAVLALDLHRAYSAGWISATATSVLLLLTPFPLEARAMASLAVGPLVGIAIHAAAVIRATRSDRQGALPA